MTTHRSTSVPDDAGTRPLTRRAVADGVGSEADRILHRSEGLFRQFAVLSALTYLLVATGTLLVLGGYEGGWKATAVGMLMAIATGLLLIPTFRHSSPPVQALFGAAAAVPAGLAAVPPGWELAGAFTNAHPLLSFGAGAVLATTTAVGFWRAAPTAGVAVIGAGWACTQAGMDYSAQSAAGILVVWLGGGLLVTATRTGFTRAIAATAAAVDAQTALIRRREVWESRARRNRLLHDTVLATTDLLARARSGIDTADARAAARRDLEILDGRRPTLSPSAPSAVQGAPGSALIEALEGVAATFAATGLKVDVSVGNAVPDVSSDVCNEASWAVREALRNVQRHAGVDRADLSISAADDSSASVSGKVVVLTLVDAGRGFDPSTVGIDRMGLSGSISDRVHAIGGCSRIWSSPGHGTTVMISIPALRNATASNVVVPRPPLSSTKPNVLPS